MGLIDSEKRMRYSFVRENARRMFQVEMIKKKEKKKTYMKSNF